MAPAAKGRTTKDGPASSSPCAAQWAGRERNSRVEQNQQEGAMQTEPICMTASANAKKFQERKSSSENNDDSMRHNAGKYADARTIDAM
jgi:hypothetical protein